MREIFMKFIHCIVFVVMMIIDTINNGFGSISDEVIIDVEEFEEVPESKPTDRHIDTAEIPTGSEPINTDKAKSLVIPYNTVKPDMIYHTTDSIHEKLNRNKGKAKIREPTVS